MSTYSNRRSVRLRGYDYSQCGLYFVTICTYQRKHLFGHIKNGEMILSDCGIIARDCWLETPQIRPNITLHEFVVMPNHFHAIFSIDARRGELHSPTSYSILHSPTAKSLSSFELYLPVESINTIDSSVNMNQLNVDKCDAGECDVEYDVGECNMKYDAGECNMKHDAGECNMKYDVGECNMKYDVGECNMKYDVGECNVKHDVGECNMKYDVGECNSPLRVSPRGTSQTVGALVRGYKSAVTKRINELNNTPGCRIWQRSFHDHIIRNQSAYDHISAYIIDNPARWQNDCFF